MNPEIYATRPPEISKGPPPAPTDSDPDCDGLLTSVEVALGLNPTNSDSDSDGMQDSWELEHNFNPKSAVDGALDRDLDTLTNLEEYQWGSNPNYSDGEIHAFDEYGDSMSDIWEVKNGGNPAEVDVESNALSRFQLTLLGWRVLSSAPQGDSDEDGIGDLIEEQIGTMPTAADSDKDGLSDLDTVLYVLDPKVMPPFLIKDVLLSADHDHDSISTTQEISYGCHPGRADTDGDGLSDSYEIANMNNGPDSPSPVSAGYSALKVFYPFTENFLGDVTPSFTKNSCEARVFGRAWTDWKDGLSFRDGTCAPDGAFAVTPASPSIDIQKPSTISLELKINEIPTNRRELFWRKGAYTCYVSGGKFCIDWVNESGATTSLIGGDVVVGVWNRLVVDFEEARTVFYSNQASSPVILPAITSHAITDWPLVFGYPRSVTKKTIDGSIKSFRIYDSVQNQTVRNELLYPDNPAFNKNLLDFDGDGLNYYEEFVSFSNPKNDDTDGDLLNDGDEVKNHHTNPYSVDTDQDGVADNTEIQLTGTDPKNSDSDNDGLSDGAELNLIQLSGGRYTLPTDPNDPDSDNDGLPDGYEVRKGFNPNDPSDAAGDIDNDGLSNLTEYLSGSDPKLDESVPGLNKEQLYAIFGDPDGDGVNNDNENNNSGSDPENSDTFGDGLGDLYRSQYDLFPDDNGGSLPPNYEAFADLDGDGVTNIIESEQGTNPRDSMNMSASIFDEYRLKKTAEGTAEESKYEDFGSTSITIGAPNNGKFLIQRDLETLGVAVSDRLVISSQNGEKEIVISGDKISVSKERANVFEGKKIEVASKLVNYFDVSDFVNSLERDEKGQVTLVFERQMLVPGWGDKIDKSNDPQFLPTTGAWRVTDLGTLGGDLGYWGGVGWSYGDSFGSYSVELLATLWALPKDDEGGTDSLHGSTPLFLVGAGCDLDVIGAGRDTPTPDDDEATEGGRITKLAEGGIPHDVSAKLVAIPTGKAAASRTITWDANAVSVLRGGVEISGGSVVLAEDQGRVELEIYAKTGFSLGQTSTVAMTALSAEGEPIGETDSVALTYVLYNFDITHRGSFSMPSDDAFEEELNGSNQLVVTPKLPETTILIEFQREWRDSTGANVEMRAVEDGSIAAVEVLEGNDFVQSIPDQVIFANGIAFVPVKFNGIAGGPVILRIKPQKAIYNNGSSHDDFEDGVSASLSPKTGGIEILPGRPWGSSTVANSPGLNLGVQVTAESAAGINLDSLILDGATLITYRATFKDHFGNQVLDGLPVDWDYVSQAETIQVDSVTNGGTAKYVAKSPDRRDCEGPAQHNLYAGCLGESNNHVMGFSELNPKGAFKQYTMATATENIPAEFPGAFVRPADESGDNLKFVHSGMILYADDRIEAIEFEAAFASDAIPIARNTRIRWQAENLGLVRKDETITLGYDPKDGYARAVARPNLSVPGPFRLVAQIGNATVEFRGTVVFRPGVAKIYPAPPSVGEYPQDRIISSDSSGNTVYDFDGPDIGNLEKIPIPVFASVIMVVDALPQFAGAKVRPYVSGISSSAFQIIPLSAHSGADIILDANGDGRFLVKSTGSTSIEGRFQIGARVTSVPSGGQFSFIPTSLVTATSERIGKIKGVVIGAIAGASYTDPTFGAIAADLAVSVGFYGDLRDCTLEGGKFLIPGVCVDRFTLAFASLGLLTNLEPIADTSVAAIKVSGKVFGRIGKSSKTFFSVARRLVDNSNLGRPIFEGMENILEFTGTMQRAFPAN